MVEESNEITTDYGPTIGRYWYDDRYCGARCTWMSIEIRKKCRKNISMEYRPIYRPVSGEISMKYWWCVGEMSVYFYLYRPTATSVDTTTAIAVQHRPSHPQLSTECRPSSDRGSTKISTVSRPTYRPLPSTEAPYKTHDPITACW